MTCGMLRHSIINDKESVICEKKENEVARIHIFVATRVKGDHNNKLLISLLSLIVLLVST